MEIKTGHYINDVWICDACIKSQVEEREKKTEEKSFYSTDHSETKGPANKAGVSSYTPSADEARNDLG
jgi:hypothetical protein